MTTIRTLISDALRESGILALGDTPEAASEDEGLRRLNVLIRSLIGNELGEQLDSIVFGTNGVTSPLSDVDDYQSVITSNYAPSNIRLVANLSAATSISLDPNPQDGARFAVIDASDVFSSRNLVINGNGRSIENAASVTLSTNGTNSEWFYRADLGNWARVTDLALDDESPFPIDFDDLLITLLAMRLNPRYGQQTGPETNLALTRSRTQFRARYSQNTQGELDLGLTRLPTNSVYGYFYSTSFNKG